MDKILKAAVELDGWLKFSGCDTLGYIATVAGAEHLIVYWSPTRVGPGGMPATFGGFPIKVKRTSKPIAD